MTRMLRTTTVLPVRDIAEAVAWYGRVLGLQVVYLHEGSTPDEVTNYAILRRDDVAVHLILDEGDAGEPWTRAGMGYLYLHVSDVDEAHREVVAAGAGAAGEVRTENWGARAFTLTDPSGNRIRIEQAG